MQIIAHRGSSGTHPENTLPAFAEAIRVGASAIELDVQLTKDQELIVIHDETLERTTDGKGYVGEKTLAELKKLNSGSWFDERFSATKLPTLKEVVDLLTLRNYRGYLFIELKTDTFDYIGIEALVSKLMNEQPRPFRYLYCSFNIATLERMHALEPEASYSLIFGKSEKKSEVALDHPFISAIHPRIDWVLNHEAQLATFPLAIRPWVVNDGETIQYCKNLNLKGIITDFPERALQIKNVKDSLWKK